MNILNIGMLKNKALELGFEAIGVAPVALLFDAGEQLKTWLAEGKNAGMGYMANHLEKRIDPTLLVDGTRSVIVTLTNYYTADCQKATPKIARYARGKDYHIVVKERLNQLLAFLQQQQPEITGRCFVDSAPLFEHEWARRAGLGWLGKNTLLINKEIGSFCFIGVILSTATFEAYSTPFTENYCGTCTRCVDACPTGALAPHQVDARRCISYQTIENKGEYPQALKKLANGRIFGCDICQDVCPWNRKAKPHHIADFQASENVLQLTADDWQQMDKKQFKQLFKNTPLERTGLERIQRNLLLEE